MAAHNWRAVRSKLRAAGVADPMALPSMHHVLDVIEELGVEAAASEGKTEAAIRSKIASFYDKLYAPDPTAVTINGDGWQPVPSGFEDDEVEASFDAFMSAVSAQGG